MPCDVRPYETSAHISQWKETFLGVNYACNLWYFLLHFSSNWEILLNLSVHSHRNVREVLGEPSMGSLLWCRVMLVLIKRMFILARGKKPFWSSIMTIIFSSSFLVKLRAKLRVPLKPRGTFSLWCSRSFRRALNGVPVMPSDASPYETPIHISQEKETFLGVKLLWR